MPEIDRSVADPHWGGLIVAYFFLGGIAAGSYAIASLARLFGDRSDRRATRLAFYLAFPLVCVCGLLLVVDLNRPERFWHMLIASETWRPMFKWWSPMSVGSWGLSVFGAFAFLSFVGVLAEDGRLRVALPTSSDRWAKGIEVLGTLSAFFVAAYTGVLLSATNQPIWAQSDWISPLFLVSGASSGIAAILLFSRFVLRDRDHEAELRLERLDRWAAAFELSLLAVFVGSLGPAGLEAVGSGTGLLIPAFVIPFGLILPVVLGRFRNQTASIAASGLVLSGGLALRIAVAGLPATFLSGSR